MPKKGSGEAVEGRRKAGVGSCTFELARLGPATDRPSVGVSAAGRGPRCLAVVEVVILLHPLSL